MNPIWISALLSIDAVLLVVIVFVMRTAHKDRERSRTEGAELRSLLEALQSEVGNYKAQVDDLEMQRVAASPAPPVAAPAPQFVPAATLSADKRAEALEMLRSGMDSGTVSARLQLSQAEAALLEKVQSMLGPAPGR